MPTLFAYCVAFVLACFFLTVLTYSLLRVSVEQPGHEASAPWGESLESDESTSNAPQPIVLSGGEGLSLNTQIQQQEMPNQITPSDKATLTGSVGTIDSSVWAAQEQSAGKGSILKGIGITCLFGMAMMLTPMLFYSYAENSWDDNWKTETLEIEWDESGLNGTFQLSDAPISSCDLNLRSDNRWLDSPDNFEAYDDCEGTLRYHHLEPIAEFGEGQGEVTRVNFRFINQSSGEAVYTVYPLDYDEPNYAVTIQNNEFVGTQTFDENLTPLTFPVNTTDWAEPCPDGDFLQVMDKKVVQNYEASASGSSSQCNLNYTDYHYEFTFIPGLGESENDSVSLYLIEQNNLFLGTQTIDENMTPLVFSAYTNSWNKYYCAQEIRIDITGQGTDWYYPEYNQWGTPPNCPQMSYYSHYETTVGLIDYESGFGEIFLDEPVDDSNPIEANYWIDQDLEYLFIAEECLIPLFILVMFIVWIVQTVRAFQSGLTNKGTGMLIGIIPAFIISVIATFILAIIIFGF